jgi:hypothetical protein
MKLITIIRPKHFIHQPTQLYVFENWAWQIRFNRWLLTCARIFMCPYVINPHFVLLLTWCDISGYISHSCWRFIDRSLEWFPIQTWSIPTLCLSSMWVIWSWHDCYCVDIDIVFSYVVAINPFLHCDWMTDVYNHEYV